MSTSRFGRIKAVHPHAWLWEALEAEPSFVLRAMFGTKAVYLGGRLALCFSARREPWRGVLVCTEQAHHASLREEFPSLSPHPILPKWLYLAETAADFEAVAERLVRCVAQHDPRIGVAPSASKKSARPRRSV